MNLTLVRAFVRQRLTSPMRVFLLLPAFAFPLLAVLFMASLQPLQSMGSLFAMLLAAGAIGQEVSSGVLQLTFARPVSRPSYVASRWAAATLTSIALVVAQLAIGVALATARGGAPAPMLVLTVLLENALLAAASASVFVGLSSLVNGLGDVAILAMAWITLQLAGGVASLKHWTLAARLCEELRHTLAPELSLAWIAGHGSPDWAALLTVLSTTVIGLAVAIVAVNRKELTYAAG